MRFHSYKKKLRARNSQVQRFGLLSIRVCLACSFNGLLTSSSPISGARWKSKPHSVLDGPKMEHMVFCWLSIPNFGWAYQILIYFDQQRSELTYLGEKSIIWSISVLKKFGFCFHETPKSLKSTKSISEHADWPKSDWDFTQLRTGHHQKSAFSLEEVCLSALKGLTKGAMAHGSPPCPLYGAYQCQSGWI